MINVRRHRVVVMILSGVLVLVASGCSKTKGKVEVRSTEQLRSSLPLGGGTDAVVATLGKPLSVDRLSEGQEVWVYELPPFPADDEMEGTVVLGVDITITNGHVAFIGFLYAESSGLQGAEEISVPIGLTNTAAKPSLKFFIVSSVVLPEGRFIDTPRFPDLGHIAGTADLEVEVLKDFFTRSNTVGNEESWNFTVTLSSADSDLLKSLTTSNISKTVVVMIGDEVVMAPTIESPLEAGRFVIPCGEKRLVEYVEGQLSAMISTH